MNEELKRTQDRLDEVMKKVNKYGMYWEDIDTGENTEAEPKLVNIEYKNIFTKEDTETHYLIEGDNYYSLKALSETHKGNVHVIYIDPPYNTGSQFIYRDRYTDSTGLHSRWLSFMEKRLELAHELLREDGVIFISIDDNEYAHLKLLMNGIFGEENFISNFIWKSFHSIKNDAKNVSKNTEYILTYAKNIKSKDTLIKNEDFDKSSMYIYDDNDGRGKYKLGSLASKSGSKVHTITFEDGRTWTPPKGTYSRYSEESIEYMKKDNRLVWMDGHRQPYMKRYLSEVTPGRKLSSLLRSEDVGYTMTGDRELKEMIGKVFQNPKPVRLIKKFLEVSTEKDSIVLDFFAGSGTTGQAVMELNNEDGGNRQAILCTNNEVSDGVLLDYFYEKGEIEKPHKRLYNKYVKENKEEFDKFKQTEEYQELGIARYVTYRRLKTVIEGYQVGENKYKEGIPANLKYYIVGIKEGEGE